MSRRIDSQGWQARRRVVAGVVGIVALVSIAPFVQAQPAVASGPCDAPIVNAVVCENSKPGTPDSDWMINGIGDASIQGYATDVSAQAGDTVHFKIDTPASAYHVDILRLGYYGGAGARKVAAGIVPSVALPQIQPECLSDLSTGLTDCGNWAESAHWDVPSDAVSGVYIAHLVRDDQTSQGSQIQFVVRNDSSHSDILVQTSDTQRNAYNRYGGNSLYFCGTCTGRAAHKVSFNRPNIGPALGLGYSVFSFEYPLITWIEQNGYDVSYQSSVDTDRGGAGVIEQHKIFVSSGHDEYWSAGERNNVEAARDAGVNLAFFSGNESFWKIRYEPSTDGTNTSYRTQVSYKETFGDVTDPAEPAVSTGTWRDTRFGAPSDGGRPENAMTGTIYMVASGNNRAMTVPADDGKMRLWRNTSIATLASNEVATLPQNTLGYEWDSDLDNGFRPAGLFHLSSTTSAVNNLADQKFGVVERPGIATHHLTEYRAASGALVFGAGTVQWNWGLGGAPDGTAPDSRMQQAVVNLFADMGVQPGTLQSGLVPATKSVDTTPPVSVITSPLPATQVQNGSVVTVSGTATDVGGQVAGVEVSTDGGTTWHPADGRASWSYSWGVQSSGAVTIKVRATDDTGNIEQTGPSVNVTANCPCQLYPANSTPLISAENDSGPVEVGTRFTTNTNGYITALRFYKDPTNNGPHVGSLWDADGNLLAQATFAGESASGWQQVNLPTPVAVTAGTSYVASYHVSTNGGYSMTEWEFTGKRIDSGPLDAPPDTPGAPNGVYAYSATPAFPHYAYRGASYSVDAVFSTTTVIPPPTAPAAPSGVTAAAGDARATVTWGAPSNGGSAITSYTVTPYIGTTAQTATVVSGTPPATSTTVTGLTNGTSYTFTVTATNAVGTSSASSASNAVTPAAVVAPLCPCTLWSPSTVPTMVDSADTAAVEVGIKFTTNINGYITGIRYYKASANTGAHTGSLWSPTGTLLATATFTNESTSGWQQVTFANPVAVTAGTTYTASYHTNTGHESWTGSYFTNSLTNGPLTAPSAGTSNGNGVYRYGTGGTAPTQTYQASNYWVDPVFTSTTAPATAPSAPSGVSATAGDARATVSWTAPSNGGSAITSYTVTPYIGATAQTPTIVSGTPPLTTTTVTGLTNGTSYTFTVTATNTVGTSPASGASNAVTPVAPPPTAPGVPSAVSATAGDARATVSWTAPSNGGSAITSYTVTPYIGATAQTPTIVTGTPPVTTTTVTGLTNGTSYTFTVTATNAVGTSAPSGASNAVTPAVVATAPSAPSGVTATAGDARATVSWTAPSNGGSAITSYTVTPYIGATAQTPTIVTGTPPVTTTTVTGLTNGTSYTFTVTATNAVGTSAPSGASNAVVPVGAPPTAPGVPSAVSATAGDARATVTWTAPSNGGSGITSYTVTPYIGATAQTPTIVTGTPPVTTTTVTGLTNGTSYTFTVTATNAVGTSAPSGASNAVTPAAVVGPACPCTLWSPSTVPTMIDSADTAALEVGVNFTTNINGYITGVRYYKAAANTGVHTGSLWSPTGSLLATATFANETTSGWQQVTFSAPVAVTAGTTYTASYHTNTGHESWTGNYFTNPLTNGPLTATNGVFRYGAGGNAPTQTYQSSNYWIDPVFTTNTAPPTAPSAPSGVSATAGDARATVTWTAPSNGGSGITSYTVTPYIGATAQTPTIVTGTPPVTTTTVTGLTNGTSYTFTVTATNAVGTSAPSGASNAVTPAAVVGPACPCTLWSPSTVPTMIDSADTAALEVGVNFTTNINGYITGVRYYKAAANTGVHTGSLWSPTGSLLATATFANETTSGWQQVTFSAPVAVTAGTTYTASYHTNTGHESWTGNYFTNPLTNGPLTATNGVFRYGAGGNAPTQTYQSSNYWIDPVFTTSP